MTDRRNRPIRLLVALAVVVGLGVSAYEFGAARQGPPGRLSFDSKQVRRQTVGEARRLLLLPPIQPIPVRVPPNARLRLGFGLSPGLWEQGLEDMDFVVAFQSESARVELLRQRIARNGTSFYDVEVPLAALAGQSGELRLETEIVKGTVKRPDLVFWTPPAIRPPPPDQRPNIVLFSIDTLRPDHLGCYGYGRDTSPTLDRLARQGVLFRQAIATSSWTLPSHASMLSGVAPVSHGAVRFSAKSPISPSVDVLPELLWESGYATAGFTDGGFMIPLFAFDRGFELFVSGTTKDPTLKNFLEENIGRAEQWIDTTGGQPFFLFLHTYAVHLPYTPPPPYDTMFDPGYEGPCRDKLMHDEIKSCLGTNGTDPAVLQHVKALYDGEIRNMDGVFSRFLTMLESKGLADDTCIIITSDHGEEFKEHGKFFHNRASLYEELIRIPLIAWCPQRFVAGRSVDEQVSLIDIAPTILELTGMSIPDNMEGISLMPALRDGETPEPRTLLSEVDASIEKRKGTTVSVRDGRYKLIATNTRDAIEVYDLHDDPGEARDVSAAVPEVTSQLKEALSGSVLSPEVAARATERAKPPPPATPDPAVLERLRALGYIE